MHNENVIFDGRKLAAYNILTDYCKTSGHNDQFLAELWEGVLTTPLLYDEFVYFLQTGELTGHYACEGYTMFDLYFYHLGHYNMTHDIGKNTADCSKDEITFLAFHTMCMLQKEPERYKRILSEPDGMDFGL